MTTLAPVPKTQWRDAALQARSGLEVFKASIRDMRGVIAEERGPTRIDRIFDPMGSTELPVLWPSGQRPIINRSAASRSPILWRVAGDVYPCAAWIDS
jgi:hypothetical protein